MKKIKTLDKNTIILIDNNHELTWYDDPFMVIISTKKENEDNMLHANEWERFIIKTTRKAPHNDLHLPQSPYEEFLVEYVRTHLNMTDDQIFLAARVEFEERERILNIEKQRQDKAIQAVYQVAKKYEKTWNEESLLDSQK